MTTTPPPIIDSVLRAVCDCEVTRLARLSGGEVNETYRADLANGLAVVVRIARRPEPWFVDEEHLMGQAREAGVPTPDVLGVEHLDHDGELLSFSVQRLIAGSSLGDLARRLPPDDLERLVVASGELLARVHTIVPDRGIRHQLDVPDASLVAGRALVARQALGAAAAEVVERGADRLRETVLTCQAPAVGLAHSDWLPKHILVDDGRIVGVIDWERAGPAPPAFDLACWEVFAGDQPHFEPGLLRSGYLRVAELDADDDAWLAAFVIDWALEALGWSPARPALIRRCVEAIARYAA